MPYLADKDKLYFDALLIQLQKHAIATPGELNFLFTEVIKHYFKTHSMSYQGVNDVVGALESCKQEFYRRIAAPYEDFKIENNGDVFKEFIEEKGL